jgi:hypothetical protein
MLVFLLFWSLAYLRGKRCAFAQKVTEGVKQSGLQLGLEASKSCGASVSRAEMAATALQEGRADLATMLLDDEPNPADQVPLLMSMEHHNRALEKALASQDPDLIFLALLHLLKKKGPQEVFKVAMQEPTARGLLVSYSGEQDEKLLRELCETCDTPMTLCAHSLPKAFKMPDLQRRVKALQAVHKIASQSQQLNAKFMSKAIDEQIRLQEAQTELEKLTGKEFVDTSAAQTVQQCFALNQYSKGVRLAKDLNMSEKLLWSLKVNGLAEGHDWRELEKLSKEKKVPMRPYQLPYQRPYQLPSPSCLHALERTVLKVCTCGGQVPPIGLEAFVEACIAHDRMDEAANYCARLTGALPRAHPAGCYIIVCVSTPPRDVPRRALAGAAVWWCRR